MTQAEIILKFMHDNNGQISIDDVKKLGLSKMALYRMAKKQQIEKIGRGVFIDPEVFGDDMAALQYRFSSGVYFKDTALFLHGMIDRTPAIYEMNFPLTISHGNIADAPLKTYRQTEKLFKIGIEDVKSPGGHLVKTYNVERTLCDILRTRDRTDAETIKQAMNSYVKRRDKNISRLTEYADIFKVRDEIQKYMEVLL